MVHNPVCNRKLLIVEKLEVTQSTNLIVFCDVMVGKRKHIDRL